MTASTSTSRARTNRGNPKPKPPDRKFSDDELEDALLTGYGVVNQAAIKLKVKHSSIRERIARDPDKWDPIVARGRATMCDLAENSLYASMKQSADPRVRLDAAKFTLATIGKARGYGQQATVDITGLAINILPDRTPVEG